VKQNSVTFVNCGDMTSSIQPPSFVSSTKTYAEYKEDLKRWSRLTSLDKKHQADMVVYYLDGHLSGVKEKIVTQISDKIVGKDDGIDQLIKFLDDIYGKDDRRMHGIVSKASHLVYTKRRPVHL
jgi:hypothetical protein